MRNWLFVFLAALVIAPQAHGAVCVPDLLSNYILLGSGGCEVGPFTVKDFNFSPIAATVVILASDITVTPLTGPDQFQLTFSASNFSVSGTDFATYLLEYTWDPGDIRSLEDVLNDPVSSPGTVQITTDICKDAAWIGNFCPTTTAQVIVSDDGTTLVSPASAIFSPSIGTAGIRETIDLQSNNGGTAQMDDFVNRLYTPEPGTVTGALAGLALLFGLRRRRG